eukprot:g12429.t1
MPDERSSRPSGGAAERKARVGLNMSALGSLISSNRRTNARMDRTQFEGAEKELRRVGGEEEVIEKVGPQDLNSQEVLGADEGRGRPHCGEPGNTSITVTVTEPLRESCQEMTILLFFALEHENPILAER